MKKILRRSLCCLLSIVLVFSTVITSFAAAEESQITPVIVVNDIDLNPIRNTDDGSVVFNFSDYQYDLLFTSGFSANITEMFSAEAIEQITNGDLSAMDMMTLMLDYLGFSGDINNIVNSLLEVVMSLSANLDLENLDIASIICSIDFKQYAEDIKNQIAADIENVKLLKMNADGTPANDNIGAIVYSESLEYYYDEDDEIAEQIAGELGNSIGEEIGYDNTFVFSYDWRIDPAISAELLADFVENVKDSTGADKVSVISEGYGSLVATEYLAENPDASDSIKNFITISSEFLGTSLIGDIFKGEIVNQFSNINTYTSAYLRYMNDLSDNPLTAFIMWLLNYIMNSEWELQSFCLEIEKVLSEVEFVLDLVGVTDQLACMPGLWALVPAEDYDDAYTNMFDENTDAALIDAVDAFKDNQYCYEEILVDAKDSGINVSVIAAWDLQIIPIGENSSVQSDGIVDTAYASFGATCIDLNDVAYAMKAEQWNEDGHDHMSANYDMLTPWYAYGGICSYIDASTCALPENTWFIKNMKHGTFSYESNSIDFIFWLLSADEERTVWDDAAYKQFMIYNRYINPGILSSDGLVASDDTTAGGYLLGDVNLDGYITSLDAYTAMSEYLEYDSIPFKNGDIDGDGEITEADAERILMISSGIDDEMAAGIKITYDTAADGIDKSDYEIELRPEYNSATNRLELTVVLLDAAGSYCGNFIINYDCEMLTYSDAVAYEVSDGKIVAGAADRSVNTLACSFYTEKALTKKTCDENGDLVLATFYLDVSKANVSATTLTAGSSYFYEDDENVYIEEITLDLDEDFFFMLGDADNNRYLSAADARFILRAAAQLESVEDELLFKRCDVDKDGNITAKDARLVLRASAKLIDSFE